MQILLALIILAQIVLPTPSPSPAPTPSPTPIATASPTPTPSPTASPTSTPSPTPSPTPNPIQHIVIIVQENRTVDNLFQKLPGADTQSWGATSNGTIVQLHAMPLAAPFDPGHGHANLVAEGNVTPSGTFQMNGFDQETFSGCPGPPACLTPSAYTYVTQKDAQPYYDLAKTWAFADHVLQSNQGPSLPAHQYLIAGQSGYPLAIAENPATGTSGCENTGTVQLIDMTSPFPGNESSTLPQICTDYPTILNELDAVGLPWKFYIPELDPTDMTSLWAAPYIVQRLDNSPADMANMTAPESTVIQDATNGTLPAVSYVIPQPQNSDHAGRNKDCGLCGPSWVASVVNAIGLGPDWANTTIILTWDDWGGWYDHYAPAFAFPGDPYEYGFRVPLVVISPYARANTIDHTQRSQAAILHYIETTFNLPSLGTLDAKTDDLTPMLNFAQTPLQYVPVYAPPPVKTPTPIPSGATPTPKELYAPDTFQDG